MLSAASAITWATRALGFKDEGDMLQDALSLSAPARETAPLFMPYLGGERTPHNNPNLKAAWQGMTHAHDRSALAYAAVEGVSFGLLDGWQSFGHTAPTHTLSAVGGGARNDGWLQLLADTLNVNILRHEGATHGGALGAARLGWLADGGSEAEVCTQPPVAKAFEPRAVEHSHLMTRHERFLGR